MMLRPDDEWSLIAFNIVGQMSVGAFLAFGIAHFYAVRKAGLRHADLLSTRALLALGPILVFGMLAVFAHVGNPDRMFNLLRNLGTSWLAREVAAYGAFLVIGGLFAVLQRLSFFGFDEKLPLPAVLRKNLGRIRIVLAWIAAGFGVLFVYCAAMIYLDPNLAARQTGWAHFHTFVLFFGDMGLLGVQALGVGFVANYLWTRSRKSADEELRQTQLRLIKDSIKGMVFASIALVGIFFVSIPIFIVYLGTESNELNSAILTMLHTEYSTLWFLRLFLAFSGPGILSIVAWYTVLEEKRERLMYFLVISGFACVLVAEIIARYLFYGRNACSAYWRNLDWENGELIGGASVPWSARRSP